MSTTLVFVVAQNDFRDEELLIPRDYLRKNGCTVLVAAPMPQSARGKMGTIIEPDMTIEQINLAAIDGLVFVGGPGATIFYDHPTVLQLVRNAKRQGKVLGAICAASTILANAGVLISKRATGFPTEEMSIRDKGGEYTGMPCEVDGLVVTAKDPSAAYVFAKALHTVTVST